jgi:exocyst complex component 4
MTNGSDDMDYQREREQAREEERARQRRIQNKAPGRRTNERVRPGDIDGQLPLYPTLICSSFVALAVLDQVKDGWEFVIDPEVMLSHTT